MNGRFHWFVSDQFREGAREVIMMEGHDGVMVVLNVTEVMRDELLEKGAVFGRVYYDWMEDGVVSVVDVEVFDVGMRGKGREEKRVIEDTSNNDLLEGKGEVRRIIGVIINFKDVTVSCTPQEVHDLWWNTNYSLTELFLENSNGKFAFLNSEPNEISVYGPVTIDINLKDETTCNNNLWSVLADIELEKLGVDLNGRDNLVYILPDSSYLHSTLCKWNGLGNVNCHHYCRIWITNCDLYLEYVHELGHNVGLYHAGSDFGLQGATIDYGDPTAYMGNKWWNDPAVDHYNFNFLHKMNLNWIPTDSLKHVDQSGTYLIGPFNRFINNIEKHVSSGIQILKSSGEYFYFSYAEGDIPFGDRLVVHTQKKTSRPSYFIASILKGQSFLDPGSRYSVTNEGLNEKGYLQLRVDYSCQFGETILTIYSGNNSFSPIQTNQYATEINMTKTGDSFFFVVNIQNNDNSVCSPVEYYIKDLDIFSCNMNSILIAPQKSCNITCSATFPSINTTSIEFSVAGTSGFENPLYNASMALYLHEFEECVRNNDFITFNNHREPTFHFNLMSNEVLTFTLTIFNNNNRRCDDSKYEINIDMPDDWRLLNENTEFYIEPESSKEILISLSPKENTLQHPQNFEILVLVEKDGYIEENYDISILQYEKCIFNQPIVELATDNFTLSNRESYYIDFKVINNNNPGCKSINLDVTTTSSSDLIASRIIPNDKTIKSGTSFYGRIIFFTTDLGQTSGTTNLIFNFGTEFYSKTMKFNITNNENCVRALEDYYNYVVGNGQKLDIDEKSEFTIEIRYFNFKYWNCGKTTMKIEVENNNNTERFLSLDITPSTFPVLTYNSTSIKVFVKLNPEFYQNITDQKDEISLVPIDLEDPDFYLPKIPISFRVGKCVRDSDLKLSFVQPPKVLNYGSVKYFYVQVASTYTAFCKTNPAHSLEISNKTHLEDAGITVTLVNHNNPRNAVTKFTIRVDVNEDSPYVEDNLEILFNAVEIFGGETIADGNITLKIDFDSNCTHRAPSVIISPEKKILPLGKQQSFDGSFTVKNENSKNCSPTTFKIFGGIDGSKLIDDSIKVEIFTDKFEFILPSNTSRNFTFLITVKELVEPGDFSVELGAKFNGEEFSTSKKTKISIPCPSPRPIWNMAIENQKTSLGNILGNVISWDACQKQSECCCPCTYEITKNGEVIGTTNELNYTDATTLSEAGLDIEYSVTVIDKHSTRSTPNTCGYRKSITFSTSSWDFFFVILAILSTLTIPLLIYIIEAFRYRCVYQKTYQKIELRSKYLDQKMKRKLRQKEKSRQKNIN